MVVREVRGHVDDRLEYEIVGWRAMKRNETEESWGLENAVLYGDPAQLDVWTELDEILLREHATEDGRMLRIGAMAVDSGGHHTDAVYKFCNRRLGRHIYAVKGMAGPRPMWPIRAGKSKKFKRHQGLDGRRRYRQGCHLRAPSDLHARPRLLSLPGLI